MKTFLWATAQAIRLSGGRDFGRVYTTQPCSQDIKYPDKANAGGRLLTLSEYKLKEFNVWLPLVSIRDVLNRELNGDFASI